MALSGARSVGRLHFHNSGLLLIKTALGKEATNAFKSSTCARENFSTFHDLCDSFLASFRRHLYSELACRRLLSLITAFSLILRTSAGILCPIQTGMFLSLSQRQYTLPWVPLSLETLVSATDDGHGITYHASASVIFFKRPIFSRSSASRRQSPQVYYLLPGVQSFQGRLSCCATSGGKYKFSICKIC